MVNHEENQNQNQKKMEEKEKKNPNPESEKNKADDDAGDEKKKTKKEEEEPNKETSPPPPPPQEVVLKVFMHCEGCARKVKRSLKGFPGVEDVITDSKTHKVVVKGEKTAADPMKVMERVQMKTHRRVELISPIPAANPEKAEAPVEAKPAEPEDKKKEEEGPKVITAVLKVHMHCDACSLAIKKRILRMKGVESVETDLKSSQVTVVGVLDPVKLADYLYKRTGKHAAIVKQEPSLDKKEEEAKKEETKEDEKKQGTGEKEAEVGAEKKDDGKAKESGEGGEEDEKAKLIGLKQNEFYYYPPFYAPKFAMDQYYAAASVHPPPPQMFSDENPNACSIM